LEEKPELQRVLEQRRLDLHREEELALQPPSDLEQELRKRQQKLQEVLTVFCPHVPYHWNRGTRVLLDALHYLIVFNELNQCVLNGQLYT